MIVLPACAKINLALEVAARRPDGFHELATVFATLDWHDLVAVDLAGATRDPEIAVAGPTADPEMAAPGALLARAARLAGRLAAASLGSPVVVDVRVEKRLPVAAGIGGGSADAAAVLRATAHEVARRGAPAIPPGDLFAAAAHLGSDVPAVLAGGTHLATGRGERLTALAGAPALHVAVAVAGASSTAETYATLVDPERRSEGRVARVAAALAGGRAPRDGDLGSALESAAVRASPPLGARLERLRLSTGLPWHLTGSGGAAFHVAAGRAAAVEAARSATESGFPARACRTLPLALLAPPPTPGDPTARPYNRQA